MKQFGLRIIRLAGRIPRTSAGSVISYQIIKSGTSAGANYRAACRVRSRADFIAKMGIVEDELDESAFWREMLLAAEMLASEDMNDLDRECDELLSIVVASIRTAKCALSFPIPHSAFDCPADRFPIDSRRPNGRTTLVCGSQGGRR
jgi:four helix bundle protein